MAVIALILAVNNGAFSALAFVGVNSSSGIASATTTPAESLDQSTTKFVPPTSTYPSHTYQNGDLNAQNSAYREGECVPFRAQLTSLDPAATQESITIQYEHFRAGNYGYWSIGSFAVDLGSNGTVDAVTITTSALPDPNATDADQTVTVSFNAAGNTSATLYWCGLLAIPANGHGGISSISGAPVHMRVLSGTETVGGRTTAYSIGNQDRSIQPAAVLPFATLSITKSGCATVASGGSCSYSILVRNTGTGAASGVVVTDALPTGLTPTSATWGASSTACGISGQTVTCNVGTVNAASSVTVTVNVTAGATACGTVTNTATLNATSQPQQQSSTSTQIQCASLSITKTTSTASVALGGTATFNIQVTNSANATLTATGVQVTDTLPAGFTYAATGTITGGNRTATVNPTAGQTTLTFGTWSIAPGQTVSITFTATAPSGANTCTTYNNNASYSSTNAGSGSTSTPAAVTVTGCSGNLSITKTTSTSSVALGGAASFTITVTNSVNATLTATGVQLTDTLPTGFTFASGTSGGTGTRTATTNPTAGQTSLTWGTWSLAPGQTATATFTATAPSGANTCGQYTNNAGYTSTNAGSGSTSTAATVTVTGCAPGVTITKTTSTATVDQGGTATFNIQVTNAANATLTATGVQVTDTLPTGFTYAATGTISGGTRTATANPTAGQTSLTFGTWSIAPGETVSITFTATAPTGPNACGPHDNNASFSSTNAGTGSTTSPATVTVLCPDISVVKTAGQAISAGSTATFTIVVTAGGTGDSTQVMLTDQLPSGTWTIGGADKAACSITNDLLSCDFGTIANGQSRTITLSRGAVAGDCPSISNTALVSATFDSNPDNDTSTATQTVNCGQISLAKTADSASVAEGNPIGFTITATNNGAGTATAATVTDTLPTNAGLSWTISPANESCSISSGVLTCNFGDLAPQGHASVHVTSPTTFASCGTVNNTATVRTGNDGTSTASASLSVTCPAPTPPGGIQVTKYNDANRNGSRDTGEVGLSGFVFTVKLSGTTVATLTTDSTGIAATVNLSAGTYTVTETQQTGWTSTDPGGTTPTKTVTVNAGQTTFVAFGNAAVQLPPTSAGTLTVTKYNDLNGNKQRDANEPALAGWTFTVRDASGAIVTSGTTDASGSATFQNLGFGTYSVVETLQAGWTSTDPGGTTPTKSVTISSPTTTVLFGNAQIKLPNTSTLASGPSDPTPGRVFLLVVLLAQALLLTFALRRWREQ